jgi:hypothetical protein
LRKLRIVLAVVLAVGIAPVWAESKVEQVQELHADVATAGDSLGSSVAIDGDTAVIGAPWVGSAYVFVRSAGVWERQAKLLPNDGNPGGASFGSPVAVDGNTVVVGRFADNENGPGSGSAYVFVRSAGVWTQQGKLLADDGATGDRFGSSVAVDGDTVLVGAPRDDDGGRASGSAYVFVRSGTEWTQSAKLHADDASPGDFFGRSLALDDQTAVIAGDVNFFLSSPSAVYVFVRSDVTWHQQAKLSADDSVGPDNFGSSASVDGDTSVIGASLNSSAYVFERHGGVWTQRAVLRPDGRPSRYFGQAVAMDGDRVLVGANDFECDEGPDSLSLGSAYVFTRAEADWKQEAKIVPNGGQPADLFGASVSVSGGSVLVGAPFSEPCDEPPTDPGSAYVFRLMLDPLERLGGLIEHVRGLRLHAGTESSLLAKLDSAMIILTDVSEDNDHAAVNVLSSVVHQVEAQRGKKIPAAHANELIEAAEEIIEEIGLP